MWASVPFQRWEGIFTVQGTDGSFYRFRYSNWLALPCLLLLGLIWPHWGHIIADGTSFQCNLAFRVWAPGEFGQHHMEPACRGGSLVTRMAPMSLCYKFLMSYDGRWGPGHGIIQLKEKEVRNGYLCPSLPFTLSCSETSCCESIAIWLSWFNS